MMWLKIIPFGQLFVVLLLVQHNVMPSSAANMVQLKNQQQTLGQASTATQQQQQQQQQQHHVNSQTQHQIQQQPASVLPGKVAHPSNSGIHGSNGGHHKTASQPHLSPSSSSSSSSASSSVVQMPQAQFISDKEATMQEVYKHFNTDEDLNDPYQILNELKREVHTSNINHPGRGTTSIPSSSSNNYNWNLYERPYATPSALNNIPSTALASLFSHLFNPYESFPTSFPITPRFMPIMSYPQPVYIPFPLYMAPEMFYPRFTPISNTVNDYEDSMSRGAGSTRHPSAAQHTSSYNHNSPIYYVRLPPTPYMFLSSLGLGSPASAMPGYTAMLPYPSLPSFSSVFNVPLNFLANGKPNNIYQMSAPPNDIQSPLQFANIPSSFNTRPPPPPPPNSYRPSTSTNNYFNSQPPTISAGYGSYDGSLSPSSSSSSSSSSSLHQDSKLTSLKRPYYFNGRPEDIYILPNNFNSLYSSENTYY